MLDGKQDPEKPFILGHEEPISYRQIVEGALKTASFLKSQREKPPVAVLLSENSGFFVQSYLGILKAGWTCVPLEPKEDEKTLTEVIRRTGAVVAFVSARYLKKFMPLSLEKLTEDQLKGAPIEDGEQDPLPRDPALILFTSGSTGNPKGVMLSHRGLIANCESILSCLPIQPDDVAELVLPLSYSFGLSVLHTHLKRGASLVINNRFMFPSSVLDDFARYRSTSFWGVPSHYQILAAKTEFLKNPLSTLRLLGQAGGRLPEKNVMEVSEAHPGAGLYLMYGATEASARLTILESNQIQARPGSIGKPIPGVDVKLFGPGGREIDGEGSGEIRVQGENIMMGYWRDPEATAEVLSQGWLRTGDIAARDAEGYLFILGRERDFIKSGGYRVGSREIENVLLENPEVLEVAVVGKPDGVLGEAIHAYVVLRDPALLVEVERKLLGFCLERLPHHKIPSRVHVREALPKTASGKVIKARLLEDKD